MEDYSTMHVAAASASPRLLGLGEGNLVFKKYSIHFYTFFNSIVVDFFNFNMRLFIIQTQHLSNA